MSSASIALLAGLLAAPLPPPTVRTLDGASARIVGSAVSVVMFWRADCGPCLLELSDLPALRRAAAPGRMLLVGLQPPAALRPALAKLKLKPQDSWTTDEDAASVLTRYGGAPPRMPLAVAFTPDGRVCDRHTGYLGRERVRAWAKSCGGVDAGRR